MKRKQLCAVVASLLMTAAMDVSALPPPQTTAFSYQGQLNAGGTLASGLYQFTFTLYNAPSGGHEGESGARERTRTSTTCIANT
jgi:hypothetical protein